MFWTDIVQETINRATAVMSQLSSQSTSLMIQVSIVDHNDQVDLNYTVCVSLLHRRRKHTGGEINM